jgi:NAD(P)-dependent dehydrogenase (short-subunit alcohol dehydrogenase family)
MWQGIMSKDRVALVTGASSGIGRAAAIGLSKAGFRLVICGRRADLLEETAAACGDALAIPCDVADAGDVGKMFMRIREERGQLDFVFNNAGRSSAAVPFGDVEVSTWLDVINVNLNGAFFIAREAFRLMRDQDPQGGRIVNNGSISAYVPRPGSAPYTASKHAITGLTRAISLDGRALQANGTIMPEPTFDVKHVVEAVVFMAGLPLDANVQFMTVMATSMPYIGRG